MDLMKIFVTIILTKLQRSESGASVIENILCRGSGNLPSEADSRSPYSRDDVIFKVSVEFYPSKRVLNVPESASFSSLILKSGLAADS